MNGLWDRLPRPFFTLAPMEDITDTVFRRVIASVGRPDVMFTEFANVEAIIHGEIQRLKFSESERPLVAQVWGNKPESFLKAAKVVAELGFDGIDINMGCPVRKIVKNGCSALIGENKLVKEIIAATHEGSGLPVSVKTRIGKAKIITEDWIGFLLEQSLACITIHGRTVTEQSKVPAHWEEISKAVKLRMNETLIIGNGDITSIQDARHKAREYGVDGVMIGRGVFKNPWLFADRKGTIAERFELLKYHLKLWGETCGDEKGFVGVKKFVKMYVNEFNGAAEIRAKLMSSQDKNQLLEMVTAIKPLKRGDESGGPPGETLFLGESKNGAGSFGEPSI